MFLYSSSLVHWLAALSATSRNKETVASFQMKALFLFAFAHTLNLPRNNEDKNTNFPSSASLFPHPQFAVCAEKRGKTVGIFPSFSFFLSLTRFSFNDLTICWSSVCAESLLLVHWKMKFSLPANRKKIIINFPPKKRDPSFCFFFFFLLQPRTTHRIHGLIRWRFVKNWWKDFVSFPKPASVLATRKILHHKLEMELHSSRWRENCASALAFTHEISRNSSSCSASIFPLLFSGNL